ncbi:acyl carrier protein [Streptosporangiaceae bacterium NEAU-GS5]|nr:acyl carrier protein [Streptosporangiaceae bacterium NEAU-GS5]
MTQRLEDVFKTALRLTDEVDVSSLEYRGVPQWDSLGHMTLIAAIEDEYGITIDTDDVIDLNSYAKAVALLEKNGVPVTTT